MKNFYLGVFNFKNLKSHHFALPRVLQGGDALGAWAMGPLVALKRAVGIRKDKAFFLVFCAKNNIIYLFLDLKAP